MWPQLRVIVEYYGLAAPRLCLAFREEPSLAVMLQLVFLVFRKPDVFKWFGLSGHQAEIDPNTAQTSI